MIIETTETSKSKHTEKQHSEWYNIRPTLLIYIVLRW